LGEPFLEKRIFFWKNLGKSAHEKNLAPKIILGID
jgi:hypothetical protein